MLQNVRFLLIKFLTCLSIAGEVTEFSKKKQAIIEEFSQKDFDYIVTGWNDKIKRCSDGDQAWGYFVAKKPYA